MKPLNYKRRIQSNLEQLRQFLPIFAYIKKEIQENRNYVTQMFNDKNK